jgi:hypothetical protein
MRALSVALACAMLVPSAARAEEPSDAGAVRSESASAPEGEGPGPLAIGAAIFPGLLLHGSGHFVAGERATARRMLLIEGAAFTAILAGVTPLGIANRRLSWPAIPLVVSGTGVFIVNWLGDLYGAAGGSRVLGRPVAELADLTVTAGYGFVRDPRLDTGSFAVLDASLRLARWRLDAGGWLGADNQRVDADLTRRVFGAARGAGSHLEVRGGLRYHRYAEDFAIAGVEVEVGGRLALERLAPTLRGSFAELGTGLGLDIVDYRVPGADTDVWDALIGGFAWGLYLGEGRGETRVFYDHRRDGFAAGLATGDRANGFVGHFGVDLDLRLRGPWGVHAEGVVGSAWVAHLAVRYRIGEQR